MHRSLAFLFLVTAFAGCASTAPLDDVPDDRATDPWVDTGHVLQNLTEPSGFPAAVFTTLGPLAAGGPVYGAGEPSTWVARDGTIYVAFPGCDRGFYLVPLPTPGAERCGHGLVYRSSDDGVTWERLNRDGDGRYTEDGPTANGDADVAVDAAGNVYASNLGGGIQFHTRWASNETWEYMANVVPEGEGADRQWMAAGKEGHVIMTWMRTSPERDVEINVTFDGGRTWTHAGNYGDGIGWLGSVQIAPDGKHAYIPYTQPTQSGTAPLVSGPMQCEMHVLRSADGGLSWEDMATGIQWPSSQTGGHWSCVHMAPSLDITGNGTVVLAYSIDIMPAMSDATGLMPVIYVFTSQDNATTWDFEAFLTGGFDVAGPISYGMGSSIMPWVTGGAGDRYAVTYLYTPTVGDQDYVGAVWDVRAWLSSGIGEDAMGQGVVIEPNVHVGGICTRGGACLLTGSDRAFLDFFEADLTHDGRLFVTYPHDLNPTKTIEIRTAIGPGDVLAALTK